MKDYEQVRERMDRIYDDIDGAWPEYKINTLLSNLPGGQMFLGDHNKIVSSALSVQVSYQHFSNPHTYDNLIGQK